MNGKLLAGVLAFSALTLTNAKAINLELALVIDASGSISAANYDLQKGAYAAAVANVIPTDGSIAVGVWQFGATVQQLFPVTTIASAADLTSLVNMFNGMNRNSINTGATAIGDGITAAYTAIFANAIDSDRQVIDVSTDGSNNIGLNPSTARTNALAAGIDQINALGVGSGVTAASLQTFVGGTDSFYDTAASFAEFQSVLERKLRRETGQVPDSGSTLVLMSLGLVCLAGFRRLRSA